MFVLSLKKFIKSRNGNLLKFSFFQVYLLFFDATEKVLIAV